MANDTKPALKTKVIVRPECDPDQQFAGIVFEVIEQPRGKFIVIEAIGNGAKYMGAKRRVRIEPVMVTADVPADYDKYTSETCAMVPIYDLRYIGEVFTEPNDELPGVDDKTLLVITGLAGTERCRSYQAVKLGGDYDRNGDYRTFKKVAAAAIRLVPRIEIASRLA